MEFLSENLLYILLFGVVAFVMFRHGGCCGSHSHAGHSHGGHDHGGDNHTGHYGGYSSQTTRYTGNNVNMVKDPVCGMYINPNTAVKSTVGGQTYYFCSEACREEFHKRH